MATPLDDDDEILDLVDENDQVVGTINHTQVYNADALGGRYIRAASCFIINSEGKLWIPRRGPHKKIAPNGLDYSAGGHVASGETYEQAMIRELAEEVNIVAAAGELTPIGKEMPDVTPPHYYFSQLYLYKSDDTPAYNPDDFVSAEWLDIDTFRTLLKNGEAAKASLPIAVEIVSAYLAQQSSNH